MKAKSFYEPKGFHLNEEGMAAKEMIEKSMKRIYKHWVAKGYNRSELRELLYTQVFMTPSIMDALDL